MTDWRLTVIAPASLAAARRELHAAVQLVSVVGRSLLPPRDDDSQTSLAWNDTFAGLVGQPIPPDSIRAGLRFADLVLCVVAAGGQSIDEYPLAGRTLADGRHWLGGALTGRVSTRHTLAPVEFPPALAAERPQGALFVQHGEAAELGNYYANADALLTRWASATSPIRVWPHHFDIAVLLPGPMEGQTIGAGLSPGDGSYREPYWYVTPWPYPGEIAFPPLAGAGTWHTGDWVGAVLPSSQMRRHDATTQRTQVSAFVASAIAASRSVLERRGR